MIRFEEVLPGIFLLKVPFAGIWTGVTLVTGEENCLIDSGSCDADVDRHILPALEEMGMSVCDISWLLNTHTHGDHVGGHARLKETTGVRIATYELSAPKLEDPAPYAIQTRTAFPEYSPEAKCSMVPVSPDRILKDGECITERLQVFYTPGHDDDCVCWFDRKTKTIISGDSLQGNGTFMQGIGFYKYLKSYQDSLKRLAARNAENILCGHDYDRLGWLRKGAKNVHKGFEICEQYINTYGNYVRERLSQGEKRPEVIAEGLIQHCGCGIPDRLFMAMYTVTGHIKEIH